MTSCRSTDLEGGLQCVALRFLCSQQCPATKAKHSHGHSHPSCSPLGPPCPLLRPPYVTSCRAGGSSAQEGWAGKGGWGRRAPTNMGSARDHGTHAVPEPCNLHRRTTAHGQQGNVAHWAPVGHLLHLSLLTSLAAPPEMSSLQPERRLAAPPHRSPHKPAGPACRGCGCAPAARGVGCGQAVKARAAG